MDLNIVNDCHSHQQVDEISQQNVKCCQNIDNSNGKQLTTKRNLSPQVDGKAKKVKLTDDIRQVVEYLITKSCDIQLISQQSPTNGHQSYSHNSYGQQSEDNKTPNTQKTPKQVKWRSNIINHNFNEDSLNVKLSETYYFYGTGLVTGEAGDMFGGNRFQGFSRHLFSDSNGITIELCKPFIINKIIIEMEDKCQLKRPQFAYKVLFSIDECMTEWQLIQNFDQTVHFGKQNICFYPRIVQYIRFIGTHGLYYKSDNDCDPTISRYFTLLMFDCIFDKTLIS